MNIGLGNGNAAHIHLLARGRQPSRILLVDIALEVSSQFRGNPALAAFVDKIERPIVGNKKPDRAAVSGRLLSHPPPQHRVALLRADSYIVKVSAGRSSTRRLRE